MSGYRPLGSEVSLSNQTLVDSQPFAPKPTYPPSDDDAQSEHEPYDPVGSNRAESLRTPEPTEEELKLLTIKGFTDWSQAKHWRWWVRKEAFKNYLVLALTLAIGVVFSLYQGKISAALVPFGLKLKKLHGGFLVPIAIIFILSFPPLFGAEIIEIICGLMWGPVTGTLISIAGTFLGELATFYAFKHMRFCMTWAKKQEQKSIEYACFIHAVREGGWLMASVARWSFMPNNFVTALFATGGMTLPVFVISSVLSLPQIFFNVFPGYVLQLQEEGKNTNIANILFVVQLALSIIMTIVAGIYITKRMDQAKAPVIYARRKARQTEKYTV